MEGWRKPMSPPLLNPGPYFADLPDPRRKTRNKLKKLHDVLMIGRGALWSGEKD